MHIFEIKYGRGRTVRPRDYESDRVDVEFTVQLTEADDVDEVLKGLRERALNEVGRGPGKTRETVAAKETASEAGGEEPAAESATEAATKPKKTRKTAAEKKAADAKKAGPAPGVQAADERGAVGDIQDEELVAEAAKAAATITPQGVKDIMADFGVPRLSTIAQEKRPEFITKLHDAIKARKEADTDASAENEIPL